MTDNTEKKEEMISKEPEKVRGRRRRSVVREQKRWIAGLLAAAILLGAVLGVVIYIVGLSTFTDLDGTNYTIKKKNGIYVICDKEGINLELSASANTSKGIYIYVTELGTEVELDPETGKCEIYSVVDTDEGEVLGTSNRIQMFKQISQDKTERIEVHNSYGDFTFYRDSDDKFQIKGFEGTPYSEVLFTSLVVSCGYTLSSQKIKDPIKDENGAYTEYGLAPEKRTDFDGNEYDYEPAWYRIVDTEGNKYTVYVGDAIPSGGGYYVKYTERDAVYIMNYSVEGSYLGMYDGKTYDSVQSVLDIPIEQFVTPIVNYPMELNNYFDVQTFTIFNGKDLEDVTEDNIDDIKIDPIVSFSFWDLEDRTGTFNANTAYTLLYPAGYAANDISISSALDSLYSLSALGVVKLGIDEETLEEYGIDDPEYVIYFVFQEIEHYIYVSHETEKGTRYLTSAIYDMIVEVDSASVDFVEYSINDWVADQYFSMNLAWAETVKIEFGDLLYTFKLDNSRSDSLSNDTYSDDAAKKGTISSDNMTIVGTDSLGNRMEAISKMTVTDKSGFRWEIDHKSVKAYNSNGNKVSIKGGYYTNNAWGEEVIALNGGIESVDGTKVFVYANTIRILDANDALIAEYMRSGMYNFRMLFQAILYATKEGPATEGVNALTEEEIAQILSTPDDYDCRFVIETSYKDTVYDFRFYNYSERAALLTVNGGNGEFRVLRTFTEKIAADAGRVMNGEKVTATNKY